MTRGRFSLTKQLNIPVFCLLVIVAALIVNYLTLSLKAGNFSYLALSIVFWSAAFSKFWDNRKNIKLGKRKNIELGSRIISCLLGILIIVGLLSKGISDSVGEVWLGFWPFLSILSISLLAFGFLGFKQHWQELVILFSLGVPKLLLPYLTQYLPNPLRNSPPFY